MAKEDLLNRLESKEEGQNTNLSNEEEVNDTAEKVGISAIKYFDLK